jgi:hypothetical protein
MRTACAAQEVCSLCAERLLGGRPGRRLAGSLWRTEVRNYVTAEGREFIGEWRLHMVPAGNGRDRASVGRPDKPSQTIWPACICRPELSSPIDPLAETSHIGRAHVRRGLCYRYRLRRTATRLGAAAMGSRVRMLTQELQCRIT